MVAATAQTPGNPPDSRLFDEITMKTDADEHDLHQMKGGAEQVDIGSFGKSVRRCLFGRRFSDFIELVRAK